ncbi:hypothetical protein SAV31267_086410 [Streptomyces avermitilis]|uniref:Uncharacterized protein n=1 Tax=Streptomyces avermitilis TaxID=33903 RepID=A0A4D4N5G6_STRAX|nr:hypothetical protein SAV31267_086410 [Streptomyces avermitilis]
MHQPPGTAEPQPEPAARGVAVAQRLLDVGDSRSFVAEGEAKPPGPADLEGSALDLPPPPWMSVLRASSLAAVTSLV